MHQSVNAINVVIGVFCFTMFYCWRRWTVIHYLWHSLSLYNTCIIWALAVNGKMDLPQENTHLKVRIIQTKRCCCNCCSEMGNWWIERTWK